MHDITPIYKTEVSQNQNQFVKTLFPRVVVMANARERKNVHVVLPSDVPTKQANEQQQGGSPNKRRLHKQKPSH